MRLMLIFILTVLSISPINATTITICTQTEFDNISSKILAAVMGGAKDITVNIQAKKLYFKDNQLSFSRLDYPDVSITINGNGTILMSVGTMVKQTKDPELMYLKNGAYYNPWTSFRQLSDTISIADKAKHLCCVRTNTNNVIDKNPKNKYIQYTCWFTSRTSPIKNIQKKQIVFDAAEWAVGMKESDYNVNMDYSYSGISARYRLFGTGGLKTKVYSCTASNLIDLTSCKLRSFCFSSFHVIGSSSKNPLIVVNQCKADSIVFNDNTFDAIGGTVLLDNKSTNVWFMRNKVKSFLGYGIRSEVESSGTRVIGNTFSRCSLGMTNCFAIQMRSTDFIVRNNTITDFCYGGIGVGIYAKTKTTSECRGEVTGNELYFTSSFLKSISQNSLMDSGAIYTWTRCDGVTISGNYIHDINGMKDNRGIFCDDGTRGVTISNNRIEHISNSYDIDLRWCDTYKTSVPDHNTRNQVKNNITTGKVRFETKRP